MTITTYQWLTLVLGVVSAIVLPLVLWLIRFTWQVRQNDLAHLHAEFGLVREDIQRMESKLDEHLRDHMRPGEWTR